MFTQTGSTGNKWLRLMQSQEECEMNLIKRSRKIRSLLLTTLTLVIVAPVNAQTTQFTYQGKLTDNGNPANGQYDFLFKLFDTVIVGTGTQLGGTVNPPPVTVSEGIFTVQLDFGVSVFPGGARFLEIAVKQTSGSTFITLGPRQPVTSNPYAIRSLAATAADGLSVACVGCITSNQILDVQGSQVTGLIPVESIPPGSDSYVQNTNTPQASVNFNIGGTGTANILNAATQFKLGGKRILSNAGTNNLFAGWDAGAGNTTGNDNSFFGAHAGFSNTTGVANSFFGNFAGVNHTTGINNSFFGQSAGAGNTTGSSNSFFGDNAGSNNTTGNLNSFFGRDAGFFNTTGSSNVYVGLGTGSGNTTGSNITIVGTSGNVGANNLSFATAIGSGAVVSTSNSVVLGRGADTVQVPGSLSVSGAFGSNILDAATQYNLGGFRILHDAGNIENLFVGFRAGEVNTGGHNSFFGTQAGESNTTGSFNSFFGSAAGFSNTTGFSNSFFGDNAGETNTVGSFNTFIGKDANSASASGLNTLLGSSTSVSSGVSNGTAIGYRAQVTQINSLVLGSINGFNSATADTNVGIGTTAPAARLHINVGVNGNILFTNAGCPTPLAGIIFASAVTGACQNYALLGGDGSTYINRPGGGSISFREGNFTQMTIKSGGVVALENLGMAGTPQSTLCRNPAHEIAVCSSSLRYKTNLAPYRNGLDVVNRLKPITFTWKDGGAHDIGLAAEDVEKVEPLLTFRNDKGEIEGVKYGQLTVVLVNAVKQQQEQIEALKKLVCADHPNADVCK